jgi:hypothetical protein
MCELPVGQWLQEDVAPARNVADPSEPDALGHLAGRGVDLKVCGGPTKRPRFSEEEFLTAATKPSLDEIGTLQGTRAPASAKGSGATGQ